MKVLLVVTVLFLLSTAAIADHQVDSDFSSEWEATGFNNGRRMVRDSRGYFHVVYHSQMDTNSAPGGKCNVMYSHSIIPAPPLCSADWAPAIPISMDPMLDDRYPSITIEHGSSADPTDNDMLHVVWQSEDPMGVYQIMHSSNPNSSMPVSGQWSMPSVVYVSPEHSLVPDVDCSFENIVHVVWQEENFNYGVTSEILYSRSIDHGLSWEPFQDISMTEFNSQTPDVATVIDFPEEPSSYTYYSSRVHVVWSDDGPASGPCIMYTSSPDAGNTWDLRENVSMASGSISNDGYPSLTVSKEDIPHTAWMHGVYPHDPTDPGSYSPGVDPLNPNSFPGPEAGMYSSILQTINYSGRVGGNWTPVETVATLADNEFPSIAVDNIDMLHLAWQANTLPVSDYDIWYADRPALGGSWSNYQAIADNEHDDLFPSEATKKTAMYSPGYDFVWTLIDSDLSNGGHGQPAALSPAHEIWFAGNTQWNASVGLERISAGIQPSLFGSATNPVSSGAWINTENNGGAVSILDISGRTVHMETVPAGSEGFYWAIEENLPEGVYRIVLCNEQGIQSSALTVLRK